MEMRLLETGRLVIDTVLVLVEPILLDPSVFLLVPDVGTALEVDTGVLGSFVMVTSGVGGDILGTLEVLAERGVLEGDFEAVVLVPVAMVVEVCGRPLVRGV